MGEKREIRERFDWRFPFKKEIARTDEQQTTRMIP